MGFGKKINPENYPKRRWSIVGASGDGKSLFATQMRGPLAVIDADNQFDEAAYVSGVEDAFVIAEEGKEYEMRDVDAINAILRKNMKGASVGTIVVDSVTPIIKRIITQIQHDNTYTKVTDYKVKSQAMQMLGDVVTAWGTDVLFVYHYHISLDNKGNEQVNTTVSELELIRLQKHLNAKLEIVRDGDRRGIRVLWSRAGRSGDTIWDDEGYWKGMPEKIETYMYANLTQAERKEIEEDNPTHFASSEDAIAWGWEFDQLNGRYFKDAKHAKNSFAKLYRELKEELGGEMTPEVAYAAWVDYVLSLNEKEETDEQEG